MIIFYRCFSKIKNTPHVEAFNSIVKKVLIPQVVAHMYTAVFLIFMSSYFGFN